MRPYTHTIIIVSLLAFLALTSACADLEYDFEDAIIACSTDSDCASGEVCIDTRHFSQVAKVCKRPCETGGPADFVEHYGTNELFIVTFYCTETGYDVTGPAEVYLQEYDYSSQRIPQYVPVKSTRLNCTYDACQLIGGDSKCPREPALCGCTEDGRCNYDCVINDVYYDPDC